MYGLRKLILAIMAAAIVMVLSEPAYAQSRGAIAYIDNNIIVIQTSKWEEYSCGELYSVTFADVGDIVVGELKRYGMYDIYDFARDCTLTVYFDEIMCSRAEANRWIRERR